MPTRNINLTDELDQFIEARLEGGRYANASEVVRAALRLLEREEQENELKMAMLRQAIAEGEASPDAEPGVFERFHDYIDQIARQEASSRVA